MSEHTIIAGGGLAGLAAAVALTARGLPVTLLEARQRLGGRAGSYVDPDSDEEFDNCQHVSLGCCTNLQHFCRTVGIDGLFRTERSLTFIGPDGSHCRFFDLPLPAPFHLAEGFRRLAFLSRDERRRIAAALRDLARPLTAGSTLQSFKNWLDEHDQSPRMQELFWHVVLVSALSESLDRIDFAHARKVFVETFLTNRAAWRVQIPTVPLNALYGDRVRRWLEARGARVRVSAAVRELVETAGRIEAVRLREGERVEGDRFILAVPHWRVLDVLPPCLKERPEFRRLDAIETAPITSVHLWFDRPLSDLPHAVFVGRLSQWFFNRTAIWNRPWNGTWCCQVVISASHAARQQPHDELVAAVIAELQSVWPGARSAQLVRARVITEARAVFSPTPGIDELRLPQQSPIPNLQLAGDWTQTGWPATMEGAVRSGYLAAENILAQAGNGVRVVQPDLPVGWLSRFLIGG